MSDPDLLLHLALDELQGEKLPDDSEGRRNAINHGASVVEDERFGRCLEFSGTTNSYVEFPALSDVPISTAMTILFWTTLTAIDRRTCLMDLEFSGKNRLALFLQLRSNGEFLFSKSWIWPAGQTNWYYRSTDSRMKSIASTWFHFAIVKNQQGTETHYLDGRPISDFHFVGTQDTSSRIRPPGSGPEVVAAPEPSCLGKSWANKTDSTAAFGGHLAHVRIYSRALTQDQINWHIDGDRTVQYRYRITHPIDFSLENRDADPTLFMDGHPDGQNMFLRVNNVTGGVVQLAPLPGPEASETNCHFELAFRPGALETNSVAKVTVAASNSAWKIASKSWAKPDDRDSLYLLCTQPGPLPDGGLTLELRHMLPDSRYGTRTTLVDFRYKNLKSGSGETISGSVQQNLDLVNHQGRRNIPLHVGFAGSNLVLNKSDKSPPLKLRVTNVLPRTDLYDDPHKAAATGILRFDDKSEFLLSFDERAGTDWALNAPEIIKDIVVRYAKGSVTENSPKAQRIGGTEGKPWQWKIPLKDLSLGPEEHLEIWLENVKASGSDGHSNLYLDYRDVPGYWNGRFTTVIEKAPLVYRNGKVGIGVEPETELHVKGRLTVDSLIVRNQTSVEPSVIEVTEGWEPISQPGLGERFFLPRYFIDAQGMVHLLGACRSILPNDPQKKSAIVFGNTSIFTLPNQFVPHHTFHPLNLPGRVQFSSELQILGSGFLGSDQQLPSWHNLTIDLSADGLQCKIDAQLSRELVDIANVKVVSVYLDGISYLAKEGLNATLWIDSLIGRTQKPVQQGPIRLADPWNAISPSRFFRDAQGVVHLFGVCRRILPNEREAKQAIMFGGTSIFTLPNYFAPDPQTPGPFRFPGRVRFNSDLGPPSWEVLNLHVGPDGSLQVNIDAQFNEENPFLDTKQKLLDVTKDIFVYLDGISYPARS